MSKVQLVEINKQAHLHLLDHGPVQSNPQNQTNQYLCFNQWTPGLVVSPSGLICQVAETKETLYAIANTKISSGCCTWELICPISCQGIQVGIVKEGINISQIDKTKDKHSISLITSTPRKITLHLDLTTKILIVLLNGHSKEKKFVSDVEDGPWYPFIEIRGQGNIIIMNPSVKFRSNKFSLMVNQIETKIHPEIIIEKTQFLSQQIYEQKTAQTNCLTNMQDLKFKKVKSNSIVIHKNFVKLITPNLNQEIQSHVLYHSFQTTPKTKEDLVVIYIDSYTFEAIFKNVNTKLLLEWFKDLITPEIWMEFLASFQQRIIHQNKIFLKASYRVISQAVLALISYYETFLDAILPIVEDDLKNKTTEDKLKNLNYDCQLSCEELFQFIYELLIVDEQLNALSFEDSCSKINSRVFSTFGRMAYYLDQIVPVDALKLAQHGLILEPGRQFNLIHYLENNCKLVNLSSSSKIDEQIEDLVSNTRLQQIAKYFNMPIDVTVNARCPKILEEGTYEFVDLSSKHSPFITVYNRETGQSTIFNCEIALFEVGKINLRALLNEKQLQSNKYFQKTGQALQEKKKNQIVEWDVSIFQEHVVSENEANSMLSEEQSPKASLQEEIVVPDPNLLDQLYSMGFSLDSAKQALILTKNVGLDQALEAMISNPLPEPVVEAKIKKELKMQWQCIGCTFLNSDQNDSCVMCASNPPSEAYIEELVVIPEEHPQLEITPLISEAGLQEKTPEQLQKTEDEIAKELQAEKDLNKLKVFTQLQEFLNDAGQTSIDQVLQINIGDVSPMTPIVLAVVFNNLQKSQNPLLQSSILLKRLMLPSAILSPYYHEENKQDKKYINILKNSIIKVQPQQDEQATIETELLLDEDCRKIIQTWVPLFSNNHQKFEYNFDEIDQYRLPIDSHIIKILHFVQNKSHYLGVFTDDQLIVYVLGELNLQNVSLVTYFQIKVGSIQHLIEVEGVIFYTTNEQLFKLELDLQQNKHTLTNLTDLLKEYTKYQIKSLTCQDKYLHVGIDTQDKNYTTILKLTDEQIQQTQQKETHVESSVDIHNLSASLIKSLASLTTQEPVYFKSDSYRQAIQLNNKPFYQKHLYLNNQNDVVLNLPEPSQIASFNIEFTLNELNQQENQTITRTSGGAKQGDQLYLPLQVFNFTGAQFNNTTFITKALFPQQETFTSNYSYPTYTFSHLHGECMLIESIVVTSSIRATQKGFPLGAGLIFLSDNPANFTNQKWDQWTKQQYLEYRNDKLKRNSSFTERDPVGYFELEETQESGMFNLDIKRASKYIMMKPTRFRSEAMQQHFSTGSVEFQFFGCHGQTVEHQETIQIGQQSNQLLDRVKFEVMCNGIPLNNILDSVQVIIESQSSQGVKPSTRLRIIVQHKQLQTNLVEEIRVKITPTDSLVWWTVDAIQPTKVQQQIVEKLPQAHQLRLMMTDVDQYEKLNQKLVFLSQDETANLAQRISCIELLAQIIPTNKLLLKKVIQDLNMKQFILLNLQITNQEPIVQRFLEQFHQLPEFIKIIQGAVLDILQNIYTLNQQMTPQGLQFLMSLVFWLARMNTKQVLPILLGCLDQAAVLVKQIKHSKPIYGQMGDRSTHAEFDQQYFSESYSNLCEPLTQGEILASASLFNEIQLLQSTSKSQERKEVSQGLDQQELQIIRLRMGQNAPSRILITVDSKCSQTYQVDLYAEYTLKWFSIFMVNQQKQAKMRIQIYVDGRQLVFDQMYGDWVMYQLGFLADEFKDDSRFLNSNLNELRVPLNHIVARYLTVQVTFSHTVQNPTMLEATQVPLQMAFIPEFNGDLTGERGFQQELNGRFDGTDLKVKHVATHYGKSQTYRHLQYSNLNQVLDSAGLYGVGEMDVVVPQTQQFQVQYEGEIKSVDSQSGNEHKIYKSYIENLQDKLRGKVVADQGTVDAGTLRASLRKLHLQLCKSQTMNSDQFNQSIDFLFTLSHQMIEIIINVDELHQSWRGQNIYGLELCEQIFQTFILEENGPIRDISLKLLQQVLLSELSDEDRIKFFFALYDKMQGDQLKKITENLQKLKIPLPETLQYLSTKVTSLHQEESINALIHLMVKGYRNTPALTFEDGLVEDTSEQSDDQLKILKMAYQIALKLSTSKPELAQDLCIKYELQIILVLSIFQRTKSWDVREFLYQTCVEPKELNFMHLVTQLLSQNNPRLKEFLQEIFQPRLVPVLDASTPRYVTQVDAIRQCQKISTYLLYQLTEDVVGFIVQRKQSIYSTLHESLDDQLWLDQLTFVVEIYSNQVDQLNKELKEQKDKEPNPRKGSSLSQEEPPQKQKQNSYSYGQFIEAFDVQCPFCSSETANILISLLKKETQLQSGANHFYRNTQYWIILIRMVQRLRTSQLVEQKIIDQIITIYLTELEDDIQQILFMDVLNLTRTLTQQSTKNIVEINSFLLKLLLKSQKSPLVRGLMTALLPTQSKSCRLNQHVTEYLLEETSQYLMEHCNLLGREGAFGCPESILVKLQLGSYMTKILVQADLQQCFSESKTLEKPLHNLIKWALYNSQAAVGGSPALDYLKMIQGDVTQILAFTQESATRIALQQLLLIFHELEKKVFTNPSYSSYQRYQLGTSSLLFMQQCLTQWLQSSTLIKEFCLNLDGFQFLLKWVGAKPQEDILKSVVEKEVAQKITLINLPGQSVAFNAQDWSTYKKGSKARIFNFSMQDQFNEEYPLLIKLEHQGELKTIRLGFLTYFHDFLDKVVGLPSAVLVEGGTDENNLQALGPLDLINDEAFTVHAVKVFQLNLLRGLRRTPGQITYLKFRIRRPIISFLEGLSQLSTRQYQNVHVAVSFLSIGGVSYDLSEVNVRGILEVKQEETAFSIIEKLCYAKFDVIKEFANSKSFVGQIMQEFEKLSTALPSNESSLTPLIVGLSKYNGDLGDLILHNFMQMRKTPIHAKIIAQIIMQDDTRLVQRITKLLDHILTNLHQQDVKNVVYLTLLIDSFIVCLLLSAKNMQNQLIQEITLPVKQEQIMLILEMIRQNHQLAQSKIFIKLLVNLLNLPFPYTYDSLIYDNEDTLQVIFKQIQPLQEPFLFQLVSPLVVGSEQAVEWVSSHLQEWFESLIVKLQDVVQTDSSIFHYFTCFDTLVRIPRLKETIISKNYHSTIYDMLKLENKSHGLLKPFDPQAIPLIVSFLGTCALSNPTQTHHLTQQLIQDLQVLATTIDMAFVESVLMPLLNFESRADICIDVWDHESRQYVSDLKYLLNKVQLEQVLNGPVKTTPESDQFTSFTSQILSNHKPTLNEAIKQYGNPSLFKSNSVWKQVHQWSVDGDATKTQEILAAMKDTPFLILIEGQNNYTDRPSIIGVYSTASILDGVDANHNGDLRYSIPESPNSFYFAYEDPHYFHYQASASEVSESTDFGYVQSDKLGSQIIFTRRGQEIINLSFKDDSVSYIDFNNYDNKPYEWGVEDFYVSDFQFQRAEFWVLHTPEVKLSQIDAQMVFQQVQSQMSVSNFGYGQLSTQILPNEFLNNNSILSYYAATPVYSIPQAALASDLTQILQISCLSLKEQSTIQFTPNESVSTLYERSLSQINKTQSIVSYEVDGLQLLQELTTSNEPLRLKYTAELYVFDVFQKLNGIQQIIETARASISRWTNIERAKVWGQYIEELHAFSAVPAFFSFFLKNKAAMQLLFELLAGLPETDKKYDDLEQSAVKFIYDTLSEVFRTSNNEQIRVVAIEKELIGKILDRIGLVSKEVKRRRVDQNELEQELEEELSSSSPEPKKRRDSAEEKKLHIKKKGVGYGSDQTGQNQKWNTQDYINKNRSRSDQLQSLLQIVKSFFDFKWGQTTLSERLRQLVLESSLLPLLESAFRSGSLLEMSKDAELNLSYLSLTKVLSMHKVLTPVLMPIDGCYLPKQIESVAHLLSQLKDVADIFFKTMSESTDSVSKTIAKAIIDTQESVQEAVDHYEMQYEQDGDQQLTLEKQLSQILALPLPKAYQLLLKDLRFDYVSMKLNNQYDHHYASNIVSAGTPSSSKLVRLAQEFADMSNSLPIDHTNSIFVRADKDRVDVMKAMVMGSKGTPYAHGAYVFDIFFDDNYPLGPPKVNLSTTGAGKVRFNPNLYACGKVCLSLLGTWRGHASENWDPKISTLLQILVSIQAIIMSEEIYFNEPGFEGEAGTEEGDRKNEAYSNIVRYSNIQYAMIDSIKNPPKGFETIVLRHFYLKKEEILEECNKWVRYAEQHEASYKGLVNDHNSNWCVEFQSKKTKYLEKMQEAVKELEQVLGDIKPPSAKDLAGSKILKKRALKNKKKVKDIKEGMINIDDADVTYDGDIQVKQLDIQDESVRDRWSRYIGAMGLEAVQKQSNAYVFISGLGALGVEIVKNIVLSGVKRLSIHDSKLATLKDLSGQFFLTEADIGVNRAQASLNKIQQLNYYVRVDTMATNETLPIINIEQVFPEIISYNVIILTDFVTHDVATAWSLFCRQHKIKLIIASVDGVFARILNDFGPDFTVVDKNGEEIPEVMIKDISNDENAVVELIQGQRHLFEDGDLLMINNVDGMIDPQGKSINGSLHKMKTINKSTFSIENTSQYSKYIRNGTAKLVKTPIALQFKPIHEILLAPTLDPTLALSDYMKLDNPLFTHIAYEALSSFYPQQFDFEQLNKFTELALSIAPKYIPDEDLIAKKEELQTFLVQFGYSVSAGSFAPLSAFFGGFVAQEIIKCLTNKFMPVQQIFYNDCVEVLLTIPPQAELETFLKTANEQAEQAKNSRSQLNIQLLGQDLNQKLEQMKLFMVGCGAIGCELLKNFAMLNLSIQGALTITDPDHIETSNLNRQFLFREKHIMKSKSQTAAAAVQQMNPYLKGKIVARSDKVFEASEHIFTDQFFEGLTLVANALDNIQARKYVDRRCVSAKVALLESGTLGPKGHVQCIIPFKTESYGSTNDPVEEGDIPYCTLKMFPEETFHCVEFAKDKFGKLFTLFPKSALKILEDTNYEPQNPEELKALRESVKLLSSVPKSYEECINWALQKFVKYFHYDIQQLLYTYPLDHQNKDGKPFWVLPKRPPQPLSFGLDEELNIQFVSTLAYLRAKLFGLETNKEWRTKVNRLAIAEIANKIPMKPWVASEDKKKAINSEVAKQEESKIHQEELEDVNVNEKETLLKKMNEFRQLKNWKINVEEFEKDNDSNGHIDFIHAFGNLRASNYKLDVMDWLTVKIKAGRIVPALATTTAAISGLQTIELVKMVKQTEVQYMKNAFINLAIPYIQLTEPGGVPLIKLNSDVTVNLWDRWDVKGGSMKLKELFILLEEKYKLRPMNVFAKSAPIYMHDIQSKVGKEQERDEILNSTLTDLFNLEVDNKIYFKDEPNYCDLTINFIQLDGDHELVKNVPMVRIYK